MNYYANFHNYINAPANDQEIPGTAGIPGRDDDKKLFIGGLTRQTTEAEVKDYFSMFGKVESVTIKIDPFTGQSRCFAFIVFANRETIDQLLTSDHYINYRKVDLKRIVKKSQHGKIFVGGLTPDITDNDIRNYFSQFGTVTDVQIPFDKVKNQRKGFCFVTFDSKNVVRELLKTPKQFIGGKEVDVKKVKINHDNILTTTGRSGRYLGGTWVNQNYGTYVASYPQDFSSDYTTGAYDGYDYSAAYDYVGAYGYSGFGGIQGTLPNAEKSRGAVRQVQRSQPY